MAKGKTATVFFCQNCGYESTKWLGQCPGCREWNTFVEETIDKTELKNTGNGAKRDRREASEPCVLSEIAIREENKTLTGIKELDRVLGGGIVQGSLTLVGGDPGIGKSTLLLQVCHNLSRRDIKYCIFPVRNPRYRSRCGRTVWGLFRSICCYCVRRIWISSVK